MSALTVVNREVNHEARYSYTIDTDGYTPTGDNIIDLDNARDVTIQVIGTDYDGSTLSFQGTMDGTSFVELVNSFNVACSYTTGNQLFTLMSLPSSIRPFIVGGSGSIDLTVLILVRYW